MAIIERNRTIRPRSRQATSKYRVKLENIDQDDIVHINITHESKPFQETYIIKAVDLKGKRNLYFDTEENDADIKVIWRGTVVPRKV